MKTILFVLLITLFVAGIAVCQTETATISGRVTDPSGAAISAADVRVQNVLTGQEIALRTNSSGLYVAAALQPGTYRIIVSNSGFKQIVKTGIVLNVQDNASINFNMQIGSVSETMTVTAGGFNVNTTDASVSTVVDRRFIESMPLNGRSFQDLLTLVPGTAQVASAGGGITGEVTVNGQRTEANYFTVDGVSANTGTSAGYSGGAGVAGGVPAETTLGTTQSLVSVDALQEFRTNTSTYSAEYGRTPGGQFSFLTRSGTNDWHGSAYDYFRNDAMDANNWFNKCGCLGLPLTPRLAERQNDFGGTLGGPILIPRLYNGKDRTFFFFSYEGLRLVVPQPLFVTYVPDMTVRQQAPPSLQPFLKAFAAPNGGEDGLNDGLAVYNLAYSAPSSVDSFSIRIDQGFGDKLKIFGRYANTPSSQWTFIPAAFKNSTAINSQSLTVGAASIINSTNALELHFNITQNNSIDNSTSTNYGGATPFDIRTVPGPNGQPFSALSSQLYFALDYGASPPSWNVGEARNAQRQYNVTANYSWALGTHRLKFGTDWRRLTTLVNAVSTNEEGFFFSEASVLANSTDFALNSPTILIPVEPVYHNFSAFFEDEWKTTRRLSFSLGIRWDVNPAPGNLRGPLPYNVDQVTDLAAAKLAPTGTPLWKTDWRAFAPRVGVAYQVSQSPGHETVLRTGFGLFYDMGNAQGSEGFNGVGFSSQVSYSAVPFPLTSAQLALPPPSIAPPYNQTVFGFDPNLKLPYTMQWNSAIEQGLGSGQTLTASYVGAGGRKLLGQFDSFPNQLGNPNFAPSPFGVLLLTQNRGSSGYNALQVQYRKNLSQGLQMLASYTWSHSIDNASSNLLLFNLLRGSSDFDIRHNFQAALTYDVPGNYSSPVAVALLQHWGVDARISARSALPVDIIGAQTIDPVTRQFLSYNADVVPSQQIYVRSLQACPATVGVTNAPPPGGRLINICAFQAAPPGVEGDAGRNSARGFDAVQANLALRRDFPIHERLHLQFRAEAFNIFNHPIFSSINNQLSYGAEFFGYASATLNRQGGQNALYQSGGPRSLQIALRLQF
jgi:hypothetical protein